MAQSLAGHQTLLSVTEAPVNCSGRATSPSTAYLLLNDNVYVFIYILS